MKFINQLRFVIVKDRTIVRRSTLFLGICPSRGAGHNKRYYALWKAVRKHWSLKHSQKCVTSSGIFHRKYQSQTSTAFFTFVKENDPIGVINSRDQVDLMQKLAATGSVEKLLAFAIINRKINHVNIDHRWTKKDGRRPSCIPSFGSVNSFHCFS